jgi:hypothetical protein
MESSRRSLAMGGVLDCPLGSIRQSICDGYRAFIEAVMFTTGDFVKRCPKATMP